MYLAAKANFFDVLDFRKKNLVKFMSFEFNYMEALRDDYTNLLNPNFLLAAALLCTLYRGTQSANM